VWPALVATALPPDTLLRGQPRGGIGRGRRVRQAALAIQVAASLLLLVSAGLLARSAMSKAAVDPGFRSSGALTFEITLPPDAYPEQNRGPRPAIRPRIVAAIDRVLERLRADPRVEAAAIGKPVPFSGAQEVTVYVADGAAPPPPNTLRPMTEYIAASDQIVAAMGARLLYGRDLTAADREETQPVTLVTRAFAQFVWHEDNVVGRRVKLGGSVNSPGPWMTVVGVIDDIRRYDLGERQLPTMFVPYPQGPYSALNTVPFIVRTKHGDPIDLVALAREAVHGVDPMVPVARVDTLSDIVSRATADVRFTAFLMAAFAVAALVLALAGLYGLVAFAVTTRTPELGLRLALGATTGRIIRVVMAEGLTPALYGLIAGVGGAWIATRLLSSLLFGVGAHDRLTFIVAPLAVLGIASVASLVPALRASRIDGRAALSNW
jgi:putative ABC transport system permease protein